MDRKEIENTRGSEDRFLWPEKKIKKIDMKVALNKKLADSKEIDGELHVDCQEKKKKEAVEQRANWKVVEQRLTLKEGN